MFETQINGRFLSEFDAHLLEYTVGESEYSNGYVLPPERIVPAKLKSRIGLRPVTLVIDVEGKSLYGITLKISELTAMLRKEAKLMLPDGFYYWCELDSISTPKQVAPWIMQVQINLSGFRHDSMVSIDLETTQSIYVMGNYEAPARFIVTPSDGVTEFTVAGVRVVNVTGTVTIDGFFTTVTDENGSNKFLDTPDIVSWPVLSPGLNTIEVSDGVTVEVQYYPIYQ